MLQEERNNFKFLKDLKHLIGNQNKEIKKSVDDVKNTLYKSKDQTQVSTGKKSHNHPLKSKPTNISRIYYLKIYYAKST